MTLGYTLCPPELGQVGIQERAKQAPCSPAQTAISTLKFHLGLVASPAPYTPCCVGIEPDSHCICA